MQSNVSSTCSSTCLRVLGVAVMIAFLHSAAFAQQKSLLGKAIYATHCEVCHGVKGKGDGPYVPLLTKPPADLTKLARGNNGVFPADKVASFIDGSADVAAHGPRDMPIWGERFAEPEKPGAKGPSAAAVHKRVEALVHYISTIQEKPE